MNTSMKSARSFQDNRIKMVQIGYRKSEDKRFVFRFFYVVEIEYP